MATHEELKDLDSIRRRLEKFSEDLGKTVDNELRAAIEAQVTALNLEKKLIEVNVRLDKSNSELDKTVDTEQRATIKAQVTALNLEKKLIDAKIDVRNMVAGAQERVTRSREALDAFKRSAAAPVGTFLVHFCLLLLCCLACLTVWYGWLTSLFLSLSLFFSHCSVTLHAVRDHTAYDAR